MSYSIDSLAPLCKSKGGEATIKFSKNEKYPKNCWDPGCEYPLTTWQQTTHAKCYELGSRHGAFSKSSMDSFAQSPECLLPALSVCICRCHVWCDSSQPADIFRPPAWQPCFGSFCRSAVTRDAAKSVKDCLEPFISGGLLAKQHAIVLSYYTLNWSDQKQPISYLLSFVGGLEGLCASSVVAVVALDHCVVLGHFFHGNLVYAPEQWTTVSFMTTVFQLWHLPINHRQIKGPDRSTNFSPARCNLYCSTLNLSATSPPFSQIASQRTSKGPISLLTKFSSLMHKAGRMQKDPSRRKLNIFHRRPSSSSALCCHSPESGLQIPRFIRS